MEKVEKQNDGYENIYNAAKKKLAEIHRKVETNSANTIILTGLKKETEKIMKAVNTSKIKLKKVDIATDYDYEEHTKVISYYKAQVHNNII